MWRGSVEPRTIAVAVQETLRDCEAALLDARKNNEWPLINDVDEAVESLRLIHKELQTGNRRPRGMRSGRFSRYVLDFGSLVVMDEQLKNLVMRIEEVYAHMR